MIDSVASGTTERVQVPHLKLEEDATHAHLPSRESADITSADITSADITSAGRILRSISASATT